MCVSEGGTLKPDRFANLDGLRGFAAFAVVISHLSSYALVNVSGIRPPVSQILVALYTSANEYVNLGRVGVILFFLISGYLIPFSLSGRDAVRHFIVGRFFRLYPLFWFSLAVASVLQVLIGEPPSVWQVLANVTMIPDAVGSTRLLDVYWTLAIEFGFYAFALVLFLCLGPVRFWIAAASAAGFFGLTIAISIAQACGIFLPLADKTYLFGAMFIGTALRLTPAGSHRHIAGLLGVLALFATALGSRAYIHFVLQLYGAPNAFIGLGSGLASDFLGLILFGIGLSFSGSLPVLVRLGRVSYSLYILHPLVMNLSDWFDLTRPLAATGLYVPVLAGIALGLSAISYRWIEAPAIALGRRLRGRSMQAPESDLEIGVSSGFRHHYRHAVTRKVSGLRGVG